MRKDSRTFIFRGPCNAEAWFAAWEFNSLIPLDIFEIVPSKLAMCSINTSQLTVLKVAELEGKFNYYDDSIVKCQGGDQIYCIAMQCSNARKNYPAVATVCCHREVGKPYPLKLLL